MNWIKTSKAKPDLNNGNFHYRISKRSFIAIGTIGGISLIRSFTTCCKAIMSASDRNCLHQIIQSLLMLIDCIVLSAVTQESNKQLLLTIFITVITKNCMY